METPQLTQGCGGGSDGGVGKNKRTRSDDNDDDPDAGSAKKAYTTAEQRVATSKLFELTSYKRDDTMEVLCETRTLHQGGKVGAIWWFENGEKKLQHFQCELHDQIRSTQ